MVTTDRAVDETPDETTLRTGPLLAIVFIMVGSVSTLWPILTPYARDLGAGGTGIGLVVGGIYATRLVLGPWIGWLADRYGYRTLLVTGTVLYIPIAIAYSAADSVAMLVVARLLHGVGSAIVLPMVMAVLGKHSRGKSGAAMARFNGAQWLGYAVGPLVGGLLVSQFSREVVFLFLAPAGALSAVAVMLADRRLMAVDDEPDGKHEGRSAVARSLDLRGTVLLAYNFVIQPSSLIILSFFPLLAETRGYGSITIGALLAIASFATAAVQPLWGRVADQTGIRPLLIAGGTGSLVSLGLLGGLDVLLVAVVAVLGAGLSMAGLINATTSSAVELGRSRGMGSYVALFQSAGSAGQAGMPLVFGYFLGAIGVDGLLMAVGILVAIASLSYMAGAVNRSVA